MTRVEISQLSPEHQKYIKKQQHESERKKKPRAKKPTALGERFDSKLEMEYALRLEAFVRGGLLVEWRYHPIRVRLAPNCTYEPDFWSIDATGRIFIDEAKGSWRAKNARDSRTRLLIAARLFPMWVWRMVTFDDGWKIKNVDPTKEDA